MARDSQVVPPASGSTRLRRLLFSGARLRFGRLGRRTAISLVLLAVIALAAASLLPYRQYRDQGKIIDRREQLLSELEEQREELKMQLERARDRKVVERQAREYLSLVRPGDEIFRVVVPADIIKLPPSWHLPGVEYLVTGTAK
ncbi:MAG: septum formation initiator family protein [Actinomycetota bacterium]|nr:septum formation initiator family protein [Actinomycetota bacterium]MEC9338642.1 septum formation initiator family protein [Actinomycetota bacterium]